jgi:hypothetical protein
VFCVWKQHQQHCSLTKRTITFEGTVIGRQLSLQGAEGSHILRKDMTWQRCSVPLRVLISAQVARYINDDRIEVDQSLRIVLAELERDQPAEFAGTRSVAGRRGGKRTDGRGMGGMGNGGGWGDDSYEFEERGGGGWGDDNDDDDGDSAWASSFAARMLGQEGLSGGSGTFCVFEFVGKVDQN